MFEIHSVDFRHGYTPKQAKQWLKKHNLKPIKPVHTNERWHYNIPKISNS